MRIVRNAITADVAYTKSAYRPGLSLHAALPRRARGDRQIIEASCPLPRAVGATVSRRLCLAYVVASLLVSRSEDGVLLICLVYTVRDRLPT